MYLHRLVYYGENRIRDLELPLVKEMKSIIAAGHRNNPPAGLTGALIFSERYFLGVLEGDRKRASHIFVKIAADPRAGGLVILSAGPVEERMFDEWTVSYAGHSEELDRMYLRYGIVGGLDPARSSPAALLSIARELSRMDTLHHARDAAEPAEIIKVESTVRPPR